MLLCCAVLCADSCCLCLALSSPPSPPFPCACTDGLATEVMEHWKGEGATRLSVAILTPYRAQVGAVRSALRALGLSALAIEAIDVCTVDSFQVRPDVFMPAACSRNRQCLDRAPVGVGQWVGGQVRHMAEHW
jgi:hypothetical protein